MTDISVIIVSYNNKMVISECLKSIEEYNDIGKRLQVIVVEQSPEDDIYEFLKTSFPWVTILRHENNGFGAGNNAGARLATAPYLLFLNPDTVLVEPICSFAIEKFNKDTKLGLFGVQLLDANHQKNSSFMMMTPYGLKNKALYKIYDRVGHFDYSKMYIQGADLFMRHDVFTIINGFDENIFMYCEETDLCLRVKKLGYKVAYDASRSIVHLEGKSTEGNYGSVLEKQLKSFIYVCKKHNLPYGQYLKSEWRMQKLKLLLCRATNSHKVDAQKQIVDMIKTLI